MTLHEYKEVIVRDAVRTSIRLARTRLMHRSGGCKLSAVAQARNDALRCWAAASILHGVDVPYPEPLQ